MEGKANVMSTIRCKVCMYALTGYGCPLPGTRSLVMQTMYYISAKYYFSAVHAHHVCNVAWGGFEQRSSPTEGFACCTSSWYSVGTGLTDSLHVILPLLTGGTTHTSSCDTRCSCIAPRWPVFLFH